MWERLRRAWVAVVWGPGEPLAGEEERASMEVVVRSVVLEVAVVVSGVRLVWMIAGESARLPPAVCEGSWDMLWVVYAAGTIIV